MKGHDNMSCCYFFTAKGFSEWRTSLYLHDCGTVGGSCKDDAFSENSVALGFGIQALTLSEYRTETAFFFCNSAVYILRHSDLCRQSGAGRVRHPNWPFLINAADVQADTEAVRPFSSKLIWIKVNPEWLGFCSLFLPAWWSTLTQPLIDPVNLDVSWCHFHFLQ